MAALAVVLTATSGGYGFARDELYFRMLRPAWGYLDQPPLTPWLVRTFVTTVADAPWAVRIPATLAAVASVLVVVLITRELGGGRGAQTLCAWAYAFASTPLLFGHVMLTATLDLVVWPAVVLMGMRALLRRQPAWWYAVGAVVGLSTYNKLLVSLLLLALGAGLLAAGPRRVLWSRQLLGGVVLALLVGAPNLLFQATHGWPQLAMGRALSAANGAEVRVLMWPFLALLLGPPLVPVWCAGWVALARRPSGGGCASSRSPSRCCWSCAPWSEVRSTTRSASWWCSSPPGASRWPSSWRGRQAGGGRSWSPQWRSTPSSPQWWPCRCCR